MTNPPNIDAIIAELSEATGPDCWHDSDIACAIGLLHPRDFITPTRSVPPAPAYTGSIEAALMLVPEGWVTTLTIATDGSEARLEDDRVNPLRLPGIAIDAATPAIALCIAALRVRSALIGEVGRDG